MQKLLGVTLIAIYLTVQANFSSLLAQPPNIQTTKPFVATISPASAIEPEREGGLYMAAENSVIPPEGQALTCFNFMLSHLRFFEAVARVCRIPLPERLADFITRGVALGVGRACHVETHVGAVPRRYFFDFGDEILRAVVDRGVCADLQTKFALGFVAYGGDDLRAC